MISILHIVRNPVSGDSRVLKETASILHRYPRERLEIAGFHEDGFLEEENIGGRQVHRWRLLTRSLSKSLFGQIFKYVEWHFRLIKYYKTHPIKIIHCHDLLPLAIAVHLKKLTGAKLIYDAHELETRTHGSRGMRRLLSELMESSLIRFIDQMITVSPSIRAWYAARYPAVNISLVRNIPELVDSSELPVSLRDKLHVPPDALLFLYLGGLMKGRGIEATLHAFNDLNVAHHVLFMGSGPLKKDVMSFARGNPRIHYHEPVPPSQVLSMSAGADVGICLYEDVCLNHRFCLPNKLFESLLSGLPVLASDLQDQSNLVREYRAGWVVSPEKDLILNRLLQLKVDDVHELRSGLAERVADLRWENEAMVLLRSYDSLMSKTQ